MPEFHRVADAGANARPASRRRGEKQFTFGVELFFVNLDCRKCHGNLTVFVIAIPLRRRVAVQPADVGTAVHDVRHTQQVQQKGAIGRAALDDDRKLGQRATQSRQGFVPVATMRDDLGNHRVELRRNAVAGLDAGVNPYAGARRQPQQLDLAGRRRKIVVRVLGIESDLDGRAAHRRRIAFQRAAGTHVDLHFDQIEVGAGLGHRMFYLQPRVDLHECKFTGVTVVQKLDRTRIAVAGFQAKPGRRGFDAVLLLGGQYRRRGFLDQLLITALHRTVAYADRPYVTVGIRNHLDLDMARALDQALHEHRAVAETLQRFRARGRVSLVELVHGTHRAYAPAAAAGGGFDHQG